MIKKYFACISETGSNESHMVTIKAVPFSIGTFEEVLSLYDDEEYALVHNINRGKETVRIGDYFISFRAADGKLHIAHVPKEEFEYLLSLGGPIYMDYDAE